ncbi:MAG: ParB/RepB/Spo0J family partition protein [Alphaproteobacteria bacterium]|nr:ParB/RepB/Spo0J family partition protein [Alphaproteobacteria bacterium]
MTDSSNAVKQLLQTKPAPLGRGLSALFGDSDAGYQPPVATLKPTPERGQKALPVSWLQSGKYQPRRHFDEAALDELATSIKEHGILQPLLVRPLAEKDRYEIIAGERRWRAAQRAGIHEVPVVIRELTDADTLEIALIENIQRQDLNALEEAEGYRRLIAEFNHTQEDLAKIIGKSRSHIANTMRLLNLPEEVKQMLEDGAISAGHARSLLVAEDPLALANEVVRDKLSVREVEARVKKPNLAVASAVLASATTTTSLRRGAVVTHIDANTQALEKDLSAELGLKVKLNTNRDGSGAITVAYQTLDQLEDILKKLRA